MMFLFATIKLFTFLDFGTSVKAITKQKAFNLAVSFAGSKYLQRNASFSHSSFHCPKYLLLVYYITVFQESQNFIRMNMYCIYRYIGK